MTEEEKVVAAETERARLTTTVQRLRAEHAFLSSTDHDWLDKGVALAQADLAGVVGEGGTVDAKAVKVATSALARSKPYLVRQRLSVTLPTAASGRAVGSGRRRTRAVYDEAALRIKYPALAG